VVNSKEGDIINGCLRDDRRYQKKLYDTYCDAMYTLAYRITNNKTLANDVLQDTFIIVFTKLKTFRKQSTLGAWIKKILIREALRKIKYENEFIHIDENLSDEVVEWKDNLTSEYLQKAISMLPSGYRTIFLLIEVEGYKHAEVAEILNISTGTSKSQLFKAKKLLQKQLSELYEK
jgi:RNA polymerase sigma factor (sigma-70 family)